MATQVTLNSGSVDSAGSLALKTNGTTTAVTINSSQGVEFNAGTAALPSITTTGDTNTGIFFPAADTIAFTEGGVEAARIDANGNLGVGTTSAGSFSRMTVALVNTNAYSANSTAWRTVDIQNTSSTSGASAGISGVVNGQAVGGIAFVRNGVASDSGSTALLYGNGSTYAEGARIDSNGNLLVGTTSTIIATSRRLQVEGTAAAVFKGTGSGAEVMNVWQNFTTGNNIFIEFDTETSLTARGTITYNRSGGLVAYNTTSDYRAKDIYGSIADSGLLIDSVPVYMGKMKGATQERPMFIAHEVPAYAHTGEKDAVDKDGNPVYQQMDTSALVPVMWAEIQSLRKRLAAAGI